LAIGDGINDVAMMKSANIAVSIKNNLNVGGAHGANHALGCSDYSIG